MSKKLKSQFSHFFREDASLLKDMFTDESEKKNAIAIDLEKKNRIPRLNQVPKASEEESRIYWRELRSFFRHGKNKVKLPERIWPVSLSPIFTQNLVGVDFPVWVTDENPIEGKVYCESFEKIISAILAKLSGNSGGKEIILNNIERIIHLTNQKLVNKQAILFKPAVSEILELFASELDVSGSESEGFMKSLNELKVALPESGYLIPYSCHTSFQLLEASMVASQQQVRKQFVTEIKEIKSKLKDLLKVELGKRPESRDPDKLHDSLSFIDSMVKFEELSSILPESSSEMMTDDRIKRIQDVVSRFEETKNLLNHRGFVFIDETLFNDKEFQWDTLFEKEQLVSFQKGEGSDLIKKSFDIHTNAWMQIIAARRIGKLELNNNYQAEVHDEFFRFFNWERFSTEELNICPHFILITDDVNLFEAEYPKLSTLLAANIPIKILAVKREAYVTHDLDIIKSESTGLDSHAELSALMLSHKNIYVAQSSSLSPTYLFDAFTAGLSAFAPAFFYVLNVNEKIHSDSIVWTSATIEGRDFPSFTYKGLLGTSWGSRFEIKNNPQADNLWPVYSYGIIDEKEEEQTLDFHFTFADLAVLNPAYRTHFFLVENAYWRENLIPITSYLENSSEENLGKIPFIWVLDDSCQLQKLAVSWHMVVATQERLDFWRFLQENSGINNYHVERAIYQTKSDLEDLHVQQIKNLKKAHELEIQKIRAEEAEKVIENLTSVLLNLDLTGSQSSFIPPQETNTQIDPEIQASEPDIVQEKNIEVEEEDNFLSNEPYIDTVLCTSCNECLDVNKRMFKYNENKMAYIDDPNAGTFEELVEAAEKCPVGIIHPGTPINPDEDDLESLIARAAKFN
jgi:ferredoxin